MPQPIQSVVEEVLSKNERGTRLGSCIERAWTEVKKSYPDRAWWRRKSTLRGLMWEKSVDLTIAEFEEDDGITAVSHDDTVSFITDDIVRFRLKKAASSLITSNYPTMLATLFHKHDADLFGFIGHHRVEVVHVFDRFQTSLEWIGIVARERGKVLWHFELPQGGAAISMLPASTPSAPASRGVLRPTGEANKKDTDEGQK